MEDTPKEVLDLVKNDLGNEIASIKREVSVPSYINAEEEQHRSRRKRLKSLSMKSKRRNRRR